MLLGSAILMMPSGHLSRTARGTGTQPAGKFAVPSWLWPRPRPSDLPGVTTKKIAEYYDSGKFELLLLRLQEFVNKRFCPPDLSCWVSTTLPALPWFLPSRSATARLR